MLAVISPAKKLQAPDRVVQVTQPAFLEDAAQLAQVMKSKTPTDLRSLMGISEKLAELNVERFQLFTTPFTPENASPASLMFAGDTYLGLEAPTPSNWLAAAAATHPTASPQPR